MEPSTIKETNRQRDRPMRAWDWCCTGALIIAVNVIMVAAYILMAS